MTLTLTSKNSRLNKYRLLLVGPFPPPKGGMSVHIDRLSQQLSARSIEHSILDESRQKSPDIGHLRSMGLAQYLRLLRRSDIVHVHSMNPLVRLGHTIAARMLGCKVVQTLHADHSGRFGKFLLRLAGAIAHERIAVSEALSLQMGRAAHVIPAFIPPLPNEETLPDDITQWLAEQTADGRRIIALNASKILQEDGVDLYGVDMIISAFACDDVNRRFAAIVCVGNVPSDEEYYASLQAQAAKGPAADRIKFVRGETNFPGVLRHSHLFVRPSRRDGDAISLREALWYGVPTIASDAAVRPDGVTLFPSRDTGQFIDRIINADTTAIPRETQRDFSDDVIRVYSAVGAAT
ncbi:glycosyltransferase family 4 protein [Hyphomicrobium sulfonivorans]|uniref:glycosyltransferase family 4 protein n=1 Tax=Hyphomicrobium sulfonivorans TaxID=121290 RepID=UPI001571301F|nr:glycosyltransferase family 4 protein [Hyphomicrobium sulfonivorans]MBI1649589.1 glycosyltransferase family 4 protein [Hyphomicrobium sulfonivorans]NSL71505.1 hypothetical protein [Hyphomicrobium sulfonivorans]